MSAVFLKWYQKKVTSRVFLLMTIHESKEEVSTATAHLRVIYLGDVVGKAGRAGVRKFLSSLYGKSVHAPFVVANIENAAGGIGIDSASIDELKGCGIEAASLGDHTWHKRGTEELLKHHQNWCVRPANYGIDLPGAEFVIKEWQGVRIGIFNLLGRVFSTQRLECPFQTADRLLCGPDLSSCDVIVVDVHAEATSEKVALGRYLDGRVTLVVGTHTHIPTADACILPNGTAYITDLGMCGPEDSVIGMDVETAISRFLSPLPKSYKVGRGNAVINGIECLLTKPGLKVERITRISECVLL
jgi:2',3'-cyclic-nucleotide 2'-phosphodiesterase